MKRFPMFSPFAAFSLSLAIAWQVLGPYGRLCDVWRHICASVPVVRNSPSGTRELTASGARFSACASRCSSSSTTAASSSTTAA